MISLDTELMKQLVESCVTANNNIEDAVAALAGITSHNDWGCREKSSIDDYTETNKQKIKQLQESSNNFLSVLRQVTHDFEAAEQSIADMAGDVDASISSIITIGAAVVNGAAAVPVLGDIDKVLQAGTAGVGSVLTDIAQKVTIAGSAGGSLGSFISKTITEPISACLFSDLKL